MNPKAYDFLPIKWLHKELVEKMLNAGDEERAAIDKAIEIYIELVAKWREQNK